MARTSDDSALALRHLTEALRRAHRGATVAEALRWFRCEAPRGPARDPGWGGRDIHVLRDREETARVDRRIRELRREGTTISATARIVGRSASKVAHTRLGRSPGRRRHDRRGGVRVRGRAPVRAGSLPSGSAGGP
jgi:hypothetical protein